jgi:hypothetical protein
MRFANEAAATALRVLDKCCGEVKPNGPWRWQCIVQNGTRLHLAAALEEGFLHLAYLPDTIRRSACTPERAMRGNCTLSGGVKLALDASSCGLQLRADIVVLEEEQLLHRFEWALNGFHDGHGLLIHCDFRRGRMAAPAGCALAANLGELLHETSWQCTERGPNDFSADLGAESAPPARIRMNENSLVLSVELVRSSAAAEVSRQALAVFLLTASSALRLARAYEIEADGQQSFGFQVNLPAAPAPEEIDHALAALSIACRVCAREASVLLDEAAARSYLAARDVPHRNDPQEEKEN